MEQRKALSTRGMGRCVGQVEIKAPDPGINYNRPAYLLSGLGLSEANEFKITDTKIKAWRRSFPGPISCQIVWPEPEYCDSTTPCFLSDDGPQRLCVCARAREHTYVCAHMCTCALLVSGMGWDR